MSIKKFFHPTKHIDEGYKEIIKKAKKGLVIGCGNKYFGNNFIYTDIEKTKITSVINDGHALPFKDKSFDTVMIVAVLEHVKEPQIVINEIHRVLKKDGIVYSATPFMQPYHPSPTDYWRFTKDGLRYLFREFEIIDIGVCAGPVSTLAWLTTRFFRNMLPRKINSLSSVIMIFFKPFQLIEKPIIKINPGDKKYDGMNGMASGYYIIAKKV
ncbi:MAG: class I SAM-dependent methyltransferase [Candidatus Aenigmatarchaeota archaeon]